MKRIFAAIKINLSSEIVSLLNSIKKEINIEKIKWVPKENIHITLKFFGDTEDNKIEDISKLFISISNQSPSFELNLDNFGFFGKKNNPKVLWLGVKKNKDLLSLVDNINLNLEHLGYISDNKNRNSHITIARFNKISDQLNFSKLIQSNLKLNQFYLIDHFTLFESVLTNSGPIYTELEHFYFQK